MSMPMPTFQVQPWPKGVGNSPVPSYVKVEGLDELDAAKRLLHLPLQREPRHDMYIRAFVRRPTHRGAPIKIYAAETA